MQRPLATVVIGGLITSTLLTLFVLPAACTLVEERWPGWAKRYHHRRRRGRRVRVLPAREAVEVRVIRMAPDQ